MSLNLRCVSSYVARLNKEVSISYAKRLNATSSTQTRAKAAAPTRQPCNSTNVSKRYAKKTSCAEKNSEAHARESALSPKKTRTPDSFNLAPLWPRT